MRLISRKFCTQILIYVFNWLYFTQCLTSFSSRSSALFLCTVFHFISSNKDEVLSINPSANIYVFGDFIIRTGLPIQVELIYMVNSVIFFLSQTTLPRWLTFLLESQTVILTVLLFWIYFFLLMLVIVQWAVVSMF